MEMTRQPILLPCLLTLLYMWVPQIAHCNSIQDAQRLIKNKTTGYDRDLRPVTDQSTAVNLSIEFDLASIQEFDALQEKITVTGLVNMYWHDELFTWDPYEYGGTMYLTLPVTKIWVPELLHANPADKVEKLVDDWYKVTIYYDGSVELYSASIFTATCNIDVSYYPFDRQFCEIIFLVWGYSAEEVVLTAEREDILQTFYKSSGEWTLVRTVVKSEYREPLDSIVVSFRMVLDRKSHFVMVNAILPMIFVSFLNVLVFLMPNESGERISYCITVLLAIAVFLTLVGDNLPKTSQPLSLYSYYLLSILIISMCITIATVCSLKLYYRSNRNKVGSLWRKLVVAIECRNKQRGSDKETRSKNSDVSESGSYGNLRRMYLPPAKSAYPPKRRRRADDFDNDDVIYMNGMPYQPKYGQTSYSDDITWHDVSKSVDKLFFVFFILVLIIDSVVFIVSISVGQADDNPDAYF